jgi:hypothetical protein
MVLLNCFELLTTKNCFGEDSGYTFDGITDLLYYI